MEVLIKPRFFAVIRNKASTVTSWELIYTVIFVLEKESSVIHFSFSLCDFLPSFLLARVNFVKIYFYICMNKYVYMYFRCMDQNK